MVQSLKKGLLKICVKYLTIDFEIREILLRTGDFTWEYLFKTELDIYGDISRVPAV